MSALFYSYFFGSAVPDFWEQRGDADNEQDKQAKDVAPVLPLEVT
jgi:hypothetical protein